MAKKSGPSGVLKCPQCGKQMVKSAEGKFTCPQCQGVFTPGSFIGIHQ